MSISGTQASLPGALPPACRLIIQSAELGKATLFLLLFFPPHNYLIVLFLEISKVLISLLSYLRESLFDSPQLENSSPSLFFLSLLTQGWEEALEKTGTISFFKWK